jgi:hypothetical protein
MILMLSLIGGAIAIICILIAMMIRSAYKEGRSDEQTDQIKEYVKSEENARKDLDAVNKLNADELNDELHKYTRDS